MARDQTSCITAKRVCEKIPKGRIVHPPRGHKSWFIEGRCAIPPSCSFFFLEAYGVSGMRSEPHNDSEHGSEKVRKLKMRSGGESGRQQSVSGVK